MNDINISDLMGIISTLLSVISLCLSQKNRKDNEKLKHDLEVSRIDFKIKESGIYKRRMDAIISIHDKLLKVYYALRKYTAITEKEGETKEDLRRILADKLSKFKKEYDISRILLPEKIDKKIENFIKEAEDKGLDFMFNVEYKIHNEEVSDKWDKIDTDVCSMFSNIILDIRKDLRNILGSNSKK